MRLVHHRPKLLTALALGACCCISQEAAVRSSSARTSTASATAFAATPSYPSPSTLRPRRMTRTSAALGAAADPVESAEQDIVVDLQSYHAKTNPAEALRSLGDACETLGIHELDAYGDFHLDKDTSYLRKFEHEVASIFDKEDAVFMPSGVMAQSIALLIHSDREGKRRDVNPEATTATAAGFLCHHSSHLLIHEKDGYDALLGMKAVVVSTEDKVGENGVSVPPMSYDDVEEVLSSLHQDSTTDELSLSDGSCDDIVALLVELPHRELGGKLTEWNDIERMAELCRRRGMKFHCDGARIFEASAGYGLSLAEIARPFDSVYVSTYKGLGALSGALLLGNKEFCTDARIWLRRFGGNLRTLLPYAASSWHGFRTKLDDDFGTGSFALKQKKIQRIVEELAADDDVNRIVTFDPQVPQSNMLHGYLRCSPDECKEALIVVKNNSGIRVLNGWDPIDSAKGAAAVSKGYGCKFELVMGEGNGDIPDDVFLRGWREFARALEGIQVERRPR